MCSVLFKLKRGRNSADPSAYVRKGDPVNGQVSGLKNDFRKYMFILLVVCLCQGINAIQMQWTNPAILLTGKWVEEVLLSLKNSQRETQNFSTGNCLEE